jgi:heme-degrading monooxygenase HmoA
MSNEPSADPRPGLFARTPEPPYYVVIFTSAHGPNTAGYAEASEQMLRMVAAQPGFLGVESTRGEDGLGITVSYWESEEAIRAWKMVDEHRAVQQASRDRSWYSHFEVRIAKVERAYRRER